jgi:thiaminase
MSPKASDGSLNPAEANELRLQLLEAKLISAFRQELSEMSEDLAESLELIKKELSKLRETNIRVHDRIRQLEDKRGLGKLLVALLGKLWGFFIPGRSA